MSNFRTKRDLSSSLLEWLAATTGQATRSAKFGPIKPVFWNNRRIYATDNSGDHLTLDLDPPAGGTYGQVLDHSHEVGPTEVVAPGWGEFLKMLVDDLELGKYVYLEHKGSLEPVEEVERELADGV